MTGGGVLNSAMVGGGLHNTVLDCAVKSCLVSHVN